MDFSYPYPYPHPYPSGFQNPYPYFSPTYSHLPPLARFLF